LLLELLAPILEPLGDAQLLGILRRFVLLGICFLGGVLEGVAEEIGEGRNGDTRHPPKICWVEIRRRRVDGRGMVSVDMRESAPLNEKNRKTGRKLRAI
jgi:hypothetical protein